MIELSDADREAGYRALGLPRAVQSQPKQSVAGTYRSTLTGKRYVVTGEAGKDGQLKIKEEKDQS